MGSWLRPAFSGPAIQISPPNAPATNAVTPGNRDTIVQSDWIRPAYPKATVIVVSRRPQPSRRFKIRNGQSKWLLRRVAENMVPQGLLNRPKKGFGIPFVGELS